MATKSRSLVFPLILSAAIVLLNGCGATTSSSSGDDDATTQSLSGGINGTVFNITEDAFSLILPIATETDRLDFALGRSFFRQNWITVGSAAEARDGLGPAFNARSCTECHFRDGRSAPLNSDQSFLSMLLRLSGNGVGSHGEPLPNPTYGDQLQNVAIPGAMAEGTPQVSYTLISGQFADGDPYELASPAYTITNLNYGALPSDINISPRTAQAMIGLGLLEDISPTELLKNEDENDSNGDGISGRPNYVWDVEAGTTKIGRFGWKANQPSVRQQVAGAFLGDIGITSSIFPNESYTSGQSSLSLFPSGGTPELSELVLSKVTTYVRNLAVPAQRNPTDPDVIQGRKIFIAAKCATCHVTEIKSSSGIIRPYTDLLLHDMGPGLADNREDFLATGREWRTAPLWGIGLIETVNGHTRFLHDGRARNLTEAILWHGGEAESSKEYFRTASRADRAKLIKFLNSL